MMKSHSKFHRIIYAAIKRVGSRITSICRLVKAQENLFTNGKEILVETAWR
ncbi:hypothetical protein [Nostoc sp. NMS1]|uniref:hypothetical protein n=1 Tax=Nostoc sp. NMS1 TaxID=2815388 RepID=UPI0025DF17D2|nr:hypothetical protein [Nostoc sp. NMS1]